MRQPVTYHIGPLRDSVAKDLYYVSDFFVVAYLLIAENYFGRVYEGKTWDNGATESVAHICSVRQRILMLVQRFRILLSPGNPPLLF